MIGRRAVMPAHPRTAGVTVEQLVAGFCLVSFWLTLAHPMFRALTYAIPLLVLIAVLVAGRLTLAPNAPPYLLLMLVGLLSAPLASREGWQDLYLMLIGISPFFFGHRYRVSWRQVLMATVLAAVLSIASRGFGGGFEFDAANSKSSFESPTSFVFGALAVWAALERRWRGALLALLLCVLTLKRIVVLAAVLTMVLLVLSPGWQRRLLSPLPMLLLNALFLAAAMAYTQGHLDGLIQEMTGQSANQLGMGRQAAYRAPVRALAAEPLRFAFHGDGPGAVYDLMRQGWTHLAKSNLHNDSLKVLIEYGGIAWVLFIALLYRAADVRHRVMMLFVNIVLLTDNALIYAFTIFVVGLALTQLRPSADAADLDTAHGPPQAGRPRQHRSALRAAGR